MSEWPDKLKYILYGAFIWDTLEMIIWIFGLVALFSYTAGSFGIWVLTLVVILFFLACYMMRLIIIGKQLMGGFSQENNKKVRAVRFVTSITITFLYFLSILGLFTVWTLI